MRNATASTADLVVLVHGIAAVRLVMAPLRLRLKGCGFRVNSWSYPSLFASIEHHAERLYEYLTCSLGQETRIHVVAHSMGSIVTRAALAIGPVANLGRLVFIAPPNRGTPLARYAAKVIGRVCTPIADLSDAPNSVVNRLPKITAVDVGVLAARFDMFVPVASTHLCGQREHLVLNATHNSLLLSKTVARLTSSFLVNGEFGSSDNRPVRPSDGSDGV